MKKKGNLEQLLGQSFEAEEQDYDIPVPIDSEDAAEMYGEALGIESAAESEWQVAAPAEPLATLAEPVLESAPRLWDGAVKEAPRTKLDELFDQALFDEWIARRPAYLEKPERFDPFDLARMAINLECSSYSTFLDRPVLTFKDALDHAMQICLYWMQEDEEVPSEKEESREVLPGESLYVHECRQLWKNAVAHRKSELARLDKMVAEHREAYRKAKNGGK